MNPDAQMTERSERPALRLAPSRSWPMVVLHFVTRAGFILAVAQLLALPYGSAAENPLVMLMALNGVVAWVVVEQVRRAFVRERRARRELLLAYRVLQAPYAEPIPAGATLQ